MRKSWPGRRPKGWPSGQSTQGARGIARDHRIAIAERASTPVESTCVGRQVDQFTDGAAPDGLPFMPQQIHQLRNGRRTDLLDDFKRHHMQVFMLRGRNRRSKGSERSAP